jgi:hypothetical protein
MDLDTLISMLKVVSITAAGVFGAMGLLTKYKDDESGKINKWGKVALAGIIMSALISLSLQFLESSRESLKQQLAAAKSAADARLAEESATRTAKKLEDIFTAAQTTEEKQSENLKISTGLKDDLQTSLDRQNRNLKQTEVVARKMDTSLNTLDKVKSGNNAILSAAVESATRETRNTIGILRTIWNESNRVEASQISAVVTFTYMGEIVAAPPKLFDGGETLTLRVIDRSAAGSLTIPMNTWKSDHLLRPDELALTAHEQVTNISTHPTVDGPNYTQTSYFTRFDGDMKAFSDTLAWNGAVFEFVLQKNDPGLVGKLTESLDWNPAESFFREGDERRLKSEYTVPDLGDDYSIQGLPVHARLVLYIRDRPIGASDAWLVKAWEHDEDVRGLIVAKFKMSKIEESMFPPFQPTF